MVVALGLAHIRDPPKYFRCTSECCPVLPGRAIERNQNPHVSASGVAEQSRPNGKTHMRENTLWSFFGNTPHAVARKHQSRQCSAAVLGIHLAHIECRKQWLQLQPGSRGNRQVAIALEVLDGWGYQLATPQNERQWNGSMLWLPTMFPERMQPVRIHPRQVKGYAHRHFPQMDSVTGMTTWCSSTFGMPWSHVLCLSSCWTRIPTFASLIAAQRNTHAPWHTARCFWGPSRMNGLLTKIHVSIAKNEFRLLKEDLLPQHPSGWHVHGSRGQGLRHMSSSKRDVRDPAPVIETFKWSQPLQIWCTCAYNTINKTFSSENINRVMVYCIYIANLQLKPDSKHDRIMLKQTFCLYPYNKIIVFRFYHSFEWAHIQLEWNSMVWHVDQDTVNGKTTGHDRHSVEASSFLSMSIAILYLGWRFVVSVKVRLETTGYQKHK